jgi:hypothetical protein
MITERVCHYEAADRYLCPSRYCSLDICRYYYLYVIAPRILSKCQDILKFTDRKFSEILISKYPPVATACKSGSTKAQCVKIVPRDGKCLTFHSAVDQLTAYITIKLSNKFLRTVFYYYNSHYVRGFLCRILPRTFVPSPTVSKSKKLTLVSWSNYCHKPLQIPRYVNKGTVQLKISG